MGRCAPPRIREAGDSAMLIQLEPVIDAVVNAKAVAIAEWLRGATIAGVRDVVSTYRSVAVMFDPLETKRDHLAFAIDRACAATPHVTTGALIEVPVSYGGEAGADLAEVAAWAGVSPEQVIERHSAQTYRVFMLGFTPGFAYMGRVDPSIAAPRRASPRLRVPAGAVAIAGQQTGVYPRESPGGWQLIGRTSVSLFDPSRRPASLFSPGDRVKFVRENGSVARRSNVDERRSQGESRSRRETSATRLMTILTPGLFTTVQDLGRWGHQGSGLPVAGAMDAVSHRMANALVGNPQGAATLEVTLSGPEIRFEASATVAITGADLGAAIDGVALPPNRPRRSSAGAVLRFSGRRSGCRAYIACDGGIDVPLVLGSRSTHTPSGLGGLDGRALRSGDQVGIGNAAAAGSRSVDAPRVVVGGVKLRVLPGPHDDSFDTSAYDTLLRSRYIVTPQSNRMGYRLDGPPLPVAERDMISDATFPGAIQVPPSGQPILLMADRQTVGGYPQIATVITADMGLAAQLAPGDWVEFDICTHREAIVALVEQEGTLRSIG
jgi:KipI family sensor histidine kinase inhibitor